MADEKKEEGKKDEAAKKDGAAADAKEGSPSKKSPIIWIVLGVVGLIIAAGVPTAYFMLKKNAPVTEEVSADAAKEGEGAVVEGTADVEEPVGEDEERLGVIFPLETFVVNLSGGKYLRAQIQLEFHGQDVPQKFAVRLVPARDSIITLLTRKTVDDLDNPKGKEALKSEIKELVNEILKKEEVKRVYFTQFVIQ